MLTFPFLFLACARFTVSNLASSSFFSFVSCRALTSGHSGLFFIVVSMVLLLVRLGGRGALTAHESIAQR